MKWNVYTNIKQPPVAQVTGITVTEAFTNYINSPEVVNYAARHY